MGITTKVLMALAITSAGWWLFAPEGPATPTQKKADFQTPTNQLTAENIETARLGLNWMEEARQDPEKLEIMECMGINPYVGSPPPGHPPPKAECDWALGKNASITLSRYPPQATGKNGQEFRRMMIVIAEALRYSRAVSYCGLRSDSWFAVLSNGLTIGIDGEEDRLRAESQEVRAFNATVRDTRDWATKYSFPSIPTPEQCREILNKPTIAKLDAIHRTLTGNYH